MGKHIAIVFVIALAACSKSPPTCDEMVERAKGHFAEMATAGALKQLGKMCRTDQWPGDLRACVADAKDENAIGACITQFPTQMYAKDTSKADVAKLTVHKYADEAYPQWAMQHSDKACPDKLDDLNEFMAGSGVKDPWGNPYKLMCGASLPPDAKHLAVLSFGPDGVEGTDDDIKSWK